MDTDDPLLSIARMTDPIAKARVLVEYLNELISLQRRATLLRDELVSDLADEGLPNVEIARLLGVTRARITQIRSAARNRV